MNLRFPQIGMVAVALLSLPFFSFCAAAQIAVSSNDGKAVLVNGVNTVPPNLADEGSTRAPSHSFYNDRSLLVVFRVNGTNLAKVSEIKIGNWSQGVAWSRNGKTLLAQNMVENSLSVLTFDGRKLRVTGEIKVKGGPEGLRTSRG